MKPKLELNDTLRELAARAEVLGLEWLKQELAPKLVAPRLPAGRRVTPRTKEELLAKRVCLFVSKIKINDATGCWEWCASRFRGGYGNFLCIGAHRFAYSLFRGEITSGMDVLHHCDNPPCCNPNHLFLGTAKDNAADMVIKGRNKSSKGVVRPPTNKTCGENNNLAKMTADKVRQMRAMYSPGKVGAHRLGKLFGISRKAARNILIGVTWKHV